MQKQSEAALDLLMISDEIIMSVGTHGLAVAARLQEQRRPIAAVWHLDGQEAPDVLANLFMLRDSLADTGEHLSEVDQRHVLQLAEFYRRRDASEKLVKSVAAKLSTTRRTLDELFGAKSAFVLAGIQSPTARKPKKLLRQADVALDRLLGGEVELPRYPVGGISVDPLEVARDLRTEVERLREALAERRRALRVAQATRKEKNRAVVRHKSNIRWTGQILEGYYQLAGETELAERLRPVIKRLTRPPEPFEDEPGTEEPLTEDDEIEEAEDLEESEDDEIEETEETGFEVDS